MSSKSSDSDSNVPKFPENKLEYKLWVDKMENYLLARGLLSVITEPSTIITNKIKLDTENNKKWLKEHAEKIEKADKAIRNKKEGENVDDDDNVKYKTEAEKCVRVANIIKSALSPQQHAHIANVFIANAYEMWRIITNKYELVDSSHTADTLTKQLEQTKKQKKESIQDYLSRIHTIISQLRVLGESTSDRRVKHKIIAGLEGQQEWVSYCHFLESTDTSDWSVEKLEQNLIRMESQIKSKEAKEEERGGRGGGESAHWTYTPGGRGGRGGFQRRGGRGGRGGYNQGGSQDGRNGNWNQPQQPQQQQQQQQQGRGGYMGPNRKRGRNEKGEILCFICDKVGHMSTHCPLKPVKRASQQAHSSVETNANTEVEVEKDLPGDESASATFTTRTNRQVTLHSSAKVDVKTYCFSSISSSSRNQIVSNQHWILDTAATCHHTGNKKLLHAIRKLDRKHTTTTGNAVSEYDEIGDTYVDTGYNHNIKLRNVIYVPGFAVNLISAAKLIDGGCKLVGSREGGFIVKKDGVELFRAERKNNLFIVKAGKREENEPTLSLSADNQTTRREGREREEEEKKKRIMNELRLLHEKFGHVSYNKIHDFIKSNCIGGIDEKIKKEKELEECVGELQKRECVGCLKGKMTRVPITGEIDHRVYAPMDEWAVDIMGPMGVETMEGHKYVLVIVDVYTRLIFVSLMKTKGEAATHLLNQIRQSQTQTERKLRKLHSDGGRELISGEVSRFLRENGTIQSITTPHTPEHNGIVERANRTIIEMARSMMHHCDAYTPLWGEAVNTAAYLLRRSLTRASPTHTPYQLWTNIQPSVTHLHVFGSNVWYHIDKENREGKLDGKAKAAIFVGYDMNNSAYAKVYDVDENKMKIIHSAKFYDESFTEMKRLKSEEHLTILPEKDRRVDANDALPDWLSDEMISQMFGNSEDSSESEQRVNENNNNNNNSINSLSTSSQSTMESGSDRRGGASSSLSGGVGRGGASSSLSGGEDRGRASSSLSGGGDRGRASSSLSGGEDRGRASSSLSGNGDRDRDVSSSSSSGTSDRDKGVLSVGKRKRGKMNSLTNENENEEEEEENTESSKDEAGPRRSERQRKARIIYDYGAAAASEADQQEEMKREEMSEEEKQIMCTNNNDPKSYNEAVNGDESGAWLGAINEELQAHNKNKTWSVITRPLNINIVSTKWIFTKKRDENGRVKRYKARLVARGFTQQYGIDYRETFAPVLKSKSLKIIIALSANTHTHRKIAQLDVKTAFLNADVKEDIYVYPPEGMSVGESEILKLNKALYGIKQAPHEWNNNIHNSLISLGFHQCVKDTCVYVKMSRTGHMIILGLFVDDMIISYTLADENEWLEIKKKMMEKYELSDMGEARVILGMRITKHDGYTYIDQQNYTREKLNEFGLSDCIESPIPGDSSVHNRDKIGEVDRHKYMQIVGSLIYAHHGTRPDITHSTNIVCRYMSQPNANHMQAAVKILRYMKGTVKYGLKYKNDEEKYGNEVEVTMVISSLGAHTSKKQQPHPQLRLS